MKLNIYLLISYLYISSFSCFLYGWNNEQWLGNCDRVIAWSGSQPADYLRLGVREEGVYRVSAADIALAMGISASSALASLNSGLYALTCGTNAVAWTTDGTHLYFPGQKAVSLYAPENVYFLRQGAGTLMESHAAPPLSSGGTNRWFMGSGSYRRSFLNVTAYFDRRSSNASLTNAAVFGMSLGDGNCNRSACEFTAALPGYLNSAATNLNLTVHAISYGDYGAVSDTHLFETFVNGLSCGTFSWSGEQSIARPFAAPLLSVPDDQPLVRIVNLTPAEHILLLDVAVEYPRSYQLLDRPLLCTGGAEANMAVSGGGSQAAVQVWNVTDRSAAYVLEVTPSAQSNGWCAVFSCGGAAEHYAVFENSSCYDPSVTGFADINWSADGAIPELVIVTPPRRWVSGFEAALVPLVELRRRQGRSVRVVDAEEIYNAFSHGLVSPHAFQRFAAVGVSSGRLRPLRYLLFAGYASTDYKLETFIPDTVFKNGSKGFPALFPLLQVFQLEREFDAMLLLPNDMMLGDADGDGVPDVAVGRFLASDAVQLSQMVAKTVRHDAEHPWNRIVIVSDWNSTGSAYYNFSGTCAALAADYTAGGWAATHYHCATESGFNVIWKDTYYETGIWYDLQEGRDMFYYLGHSSDTLMGHSNSSGKFLFNQSRISTADWSYAPLAMAMGCRMGRYTALDVVGLTTCLMETAVRNPTSAFAALITPAGYITFGDAREYSKLFSDEVNLYGARTVGDASLAVFDQMGAATLAGLQHLVLLGDPSLPVRRVKYGTVFKVQ